MLKDEIKKGVKIVGLFDLISKPTPPLHGSWTVTKNLMASNVITFYPNQSGKKPVPDPAVQARRELEHADDRHRGHQR